MANQQGLTAEDTFPEIKYRLNVGETFSIVGTAKRRISIRRGRSEKSYLLQELDIRFVLENEVTALDGDISTIESYMREVAVKGTVMGRPVQLAPSGRILANGYRANLLKPFCESVGDKFSVTKSLYGPITAVEGGEKTAGALGGISLQSGLTWYGANFPKGPLTAGQTWSKNFDLVIGPGFLGVPGGAEHSVNVTCDYLVDGWEDFQDLHCPNVTQSLDFEGDSGWGPFRIRSKGKGTGLILPNLRDGKIARSKKDASFTVDVCPRGTKRPVSVLEIDLHTDSWHE